MIAWRILHQRHAHDPLSGLGAMKYGGRWNIAGAPIVYAAQTYSLALIELMANVNDYRLLCDFVAIKIEMYATIKTIRIEPSDLPAGWDAVPSGEISRRFGDNWLKQGKSVVMLVPSSMAPDGKVVLINPLHPDISKISCKDPEPLVAIRRLIKTGK